MTHLLTYSLTDNLKARDASASKKKKSKISNEEKKREPPALFRN